MSDLDWMARRAAAAKARQQAREEAERAPDEDAWHEYVATRGGFNSYRLGDVYAHAHYAHGNSTIDARTGDCLGVFSVVIEEDAPPPPEVCPICRDFAESWRPA